MAFENESKTREEQGRQVRRPSFEAIRLSASHPLTSVFEVSVRRDCETRSVRALRRVSTDPCIATAIVLSIHGETETARKLDTKKRKKNLQSKASLLLSRDQD